MAEYKSIKGNKIQNYTTDPDNPLTGQVWYNETDQVLKVNAGPLVTAWATGGDLNTARQGPGAAGTQTAALGFGGQTANVETYNGTNWTEVNNLSAFKSFLGGAGTQTAALAFGGVGPYPSPTVAETESWNGTNWTELNDMNTARYLLGSCGDTNTAALGFGGVTLTPPVPTTAVTESWNGTNWTEVNDLNTLRYGITGAGTNTAALGFGGYTPNPAPPPSMIVVSSTESWNGTNWTEVNDLNTARRNTGGAGTQTAALAFGGAPTTGATEEWNGTNWTEVNDLSTARRSMGGAGTQTVALAFGGEVSPDTTATEEWGTSGGNKTITSS